MTCCAGLLVCRLGNEELRTTARARDLNPKWRQSFILPIMSTQHTTLHFDVKDDDNESVYSDGHHHMGVGMCDVRNLLLNRSKAATITLQPEAGAPIYKSKQRGTLKLGLSIVDRVMEVAVAAAASAAAAALTAAEDGVCSQA